MSDRTMKLVKDIEIVDGKQQLVYKTYPYPILVKGGMTIKAIDLAAELEKNESELNSGMIYQLADFVVEVYKNQFTRDELIDGIQAHELMSKLTGVLTFVLSGAEDKGKQREFIQEKTS